MQNAQNDRHECRRGNPVRRVSIRCPDIESYHAALASCWDVDDVQLGAGRLDAALRFAATPDLMICKSGFGASWRAGGGLADGFVVLCVADPSAPNPQWRGEMFSKRKIAIARQGCEIDAVFQSRHVHTSLIVRVDSLARAWKEIAGVDPDFLSQGGDWIEVDPSAQNVFRRDLLRLVADPPEDGSRFENEAMDALVDAVGPTPRLRMSDSRCRGLVRRATDLAEGSPVPLSVTELCRRLHVSKRTLQYAFRQHLQTSPAAYFRIRRLNQCRKMLVEADPADATVTSVATRCGFTELGRFSRDFRNHFHEYPSETLRKAARV